MTASSTALSQRPSWSRQRNRESLFAVLGQSAGRDYVDDVPTPLESVKLRLPTGEQFDRRIAAWSLVGDLHFLFVFDTGRGGLSFASPAELRDLQIRSLGEALDLATFNTKRESGEPRRSRWKAGVMQVHGGSPELNSAYFLDRGYWQLLQSEHATPLVAAVPALKTVLYAPADRADDVKLLQREAREIYSESGQLKISPSAFLFQDGKWLVVRESK